MKYNITRNGELVKSFIEINDETFNDLGLEEDTEYDYTVEIAGHPESKASVSTKTKAEFVPTHTFVSNRELTWDDLPVNRQEDNGTLTLVSDNGGNRTYTAKFHWDNSFYTPLSWLVDVLEFGNNQLLSGVLAFWQSPAAQITALPDLDTSNLESMQGMFMEAKNFNQPLDNFDTSKVTNMAWMFHQSHKFDQSLDSFDTSKVEDMEHMFFDCYKFNQPLGHFETELVTNMAMMFAEARLFDQNISNWCVELIDSKQEWFDKGAGFEGQDKKQPCWGECGCPPPATTILVSNKTLTWDDLPAYGQSDNGSLVETDNGDGTYTYEADFEWDNSERKTLDWIVDVLQFKNNQLKTGYHAFRNLVVTQLTALPDLDTSNLTTLEGMFWKAKVFNQPLDNFDTSNVTDMQDMFANAYGFNQPLNHLDVTSVLTMRFMFREARIFNQPLDNWDTSSVTDMSTMFHWSYAFDQDISMWCVSQIPSKPKDFAVNAAFEHQFAKLPCWGYCGCPDAPTTTILTSDKSLTWDELPTQDANDGSLELLYREPRDTYTYEANFEWDNTSNKSLSWLVDVIRFKNNQLKSGSYAFKSMPAAQLTALPDLDTSNITEMNMMFRECSNFNQPLDHFDTSNVEEMQYMFSGAAAFDQDLSSWCVENIQSYSDFDEGAGFEGQTAKQPKWGQPC